MVGSTKHALPEHWTELTAKRALRQTCADQVQQLKVSCATHCRKKHVTECEKCFPKVLDTMRARYCDVSGREWFSQRRAFLEELESLFADVQQRKTDLESIEARIDSEKEAWYRWVLRTYPDFLGVADSGVDQDEVRSMLNDPDRPRPALIELVWEGVGRPQDWSAKLDELSAKFTAASGDPVQLKKLYIDEFFKEQSGEVAGTAQKYLEAYEANEAMTLEDAIDQIAQDHRAGLSLLTQRDSHNKRLDELRRAKMAFEQNRRQAKIKAAAAQVPPAAEELYDLPPCLVCGKDVDPKDIFSCGLCQSLTRLGGEKKLTVYCSQDCYQKGHDDHVDREHDCEAADSCAQCHDEDIDMDDRDQTVLCKECIENKKATLYCSERCAALNLARHREEKHGVRLPVRDIKPLIVPLEEVVEKTLKEGNPGVKFKRAGDGDDSYMMPA